MKRLMILAMAALLSLFAAGCGGGAAAADGGKSMGEAKDLPPCCANRAAGTEQGAVQRISAEAAQKLMATASGYILLDVRTPAEYADGHIPKAVNLPNETIAAQPPAILPDKDQLILVYCRSGRRSHDAATKLAAMGYTNIVDFGGITDWHGEIVK